MSTERPKPKEKVLQKTEVDEASKISYCLVLTISVPPQKQEEKVAVTTTDKETCKYTIRIK